MTPEQLREIEHLGFAVYGFAPTTCPASILFDWAVDWFTRLGCAPDKADADIGAKSNGNYKSFRTVDRKARAVGFAGVTNWCMLDIPDDLADEKYGQLSGQNMGISFDTRTLNKNLVFHIREALIRDRIEEFLEAAKQACELLQPQYGISYRRKFWFGPELYGMGMRFNGNTALDDENMEMWSLMMSHEAYTLLRTVYPWSFLTKTQLDLKVGDVRLEDWIRAKPGRGDLSPFTNQVTLWTVPEKDIHPVRDELWKAGVVLDRKRHFDDVWEKYYVSCEQIADSLRTGVPITGPPRRGPGISEQQMLQSVLGVFGTPESQVFKVEKSGKLRELTPAELPPVKKKSGKKEHDAGRD
jgi:hypothetical protein